MTFQLVSTTVKEYDITASEEHKKKYTFQFDTLLPNVYIGMNVNFGNEGTDKEFIDSRKTKYSYVAKKNGSIRLVAALKPKFKQKVTDNDGRIYLYYTFGPGDGTGRDFEGGDMGAKLEMCFFKSSYNNKQYSPYNGEKVYFNSNPFTMQNHIGNQWLLPDLNMSNAMVGFQSCRIDVTLDTDKDKRMLEKHVVIHVLDNTGNLLFIYEKDSPHDNIVYLPDTGIQILCLIKYTQVGNTLDYSIGDPKTDAKITVTEDDV